MSAPSLLEQGRSAYRNEAWLTAFDALTAADRAEPLAADDLEILALTAYMLGRDEAYAAAFERAHQRHVEAGEVERAARCGFWVGMSYMHRNEHARGAGWFARCERLVEDSPESALHGWLMIPGWLQAMGKGDYERGRELTARATSIAERAGDVDLLWLARHDGARALLYLGQDDEALRTVDEALVAATSGELSSPIVVGIVYCNTIGFCRSNFALRQMREWTRALSQWCDRQPEMIAHNGVCRVHRAEVLLVEGAWEHALAWARESAEYFAVGTLNHQALREAHYCLGEAYRLRGALDAAEEAYRRASEIGRDPQPGLALLRLAQNKRDAAEAAIRRVASERTAPLARARILPAFVEIMLAVGKVDLARDGARELDEIATAFPREVLEAMAAHARGAVALAEGNATESLVHLRRAWKLWEDLGALHEVARIRARVGLACRAAGDHDTAALELDAAARTFDALGAPTDRAWVASLSSAPPPPTPPATQLSPREVEVLRLVAEGLSNGDIGARLFISDLTVKRHVANILTKLGLPTRAAAATYAARTGLV